LLDQRVIDDAVATFHTAIDDAHSVGAVTSAFAKHVAVLHATLRQPHDADREAKLTRALRFIESHLDRPLSLPEVARVAGYAPDYFSRLFRELHGQTFEQRLLTLRIARARQLLHTTELPIGQVAIACGFSAAAYFYRAFRKATGKTPARFRSTRPGYAPPVGSKVSRTDKVSMKNGSG
jgi:transcriptional regulator GlxA family with amidase domain